MAMNVEPVTLTGNVVRLEPLQTRACRRVFFVRHMTLLSGRICLIIPLLSLDAMNTFGLPMR